MERCFRETRRSKRKDGVSRDHRPESATDLLSCEWRRRIEKFVGSNPEVAKNFLKSWLEGIKAFKTDKELSLKVLAKYPKINDRDVLEKSYEIYRPVYKKVPYGDRRAVNFALEQMSKELPEAAKLNADDFIDNRIISELEKSGFIDQIYAEPSRK
jgi:hypothetical protein